MHIDQYPINVKEANNCFLLTCNNLNIITKGTDLLKAYHEMKICREETLKQLERAGILFSDLNERKLANYEIFLIMVSIMIVSIVSLLTPFFNS
jgi:hypothetical protein